MNTVLKIDDQAIDADEFLQQLRLNGQLEGLIEQFVRERVTVQAAKKAGLRVTAEEVQQRADQFRRVRGLHRAAETNKFLDAMHVSMDEFEAFIADGLYQDKMMAQVCSDEAVLAWFKLNSPRFDSVELRHIVVDSEGKDKEMVAVLGDDPDCFEEMAREHSIAHTRDQGGQLGRVKRGSLRNDIEAKLFHAAEGELLGPFASADKSVFEVFRVDAKHAARLDDETAAEVRRLLREQWLRTRAQEHLIQVC